MYSKHTLSVVADQVRTSCLEAKQQISKLQVEKGYEQSVSHEIFKFVNKIIDVGLKSVTKEDAANILKAKIQKFEVNFEGLNQDSEASTAAVEALKAQVKDAFSQHS